MINNFRISILIASAALLPACNQSDTVENPNILFIIADDLGYHDLSCMGSDYYETPNIDHIADNAMVFSNGYATCQVCSPSRASIMSGKFPARHGITDYIGARTGEEWRKMNRNSVLLPADYVPHLPHEYITLPEALHEAGYKTFFAGKWHLGGEGSYPEDHGFDINKGGYEKGGPYSGGYFSPFNNPKMEDYPDEKGMSLSMKLAKETVKFIKENKDSPFYAQLSFYAVHAPIQTTKEKWEKYRDKAESSGIAESGFEMERRLPIRVEQDNPVYAGLVEQMDDAVGFVLHTLDELGLKENTVIIFTSDNGGVASGDNFATSNLPLRGGKGYQWEGGIKEPYLISVPWLHQNGTECDVPVSGTDFYPTILELTGVAQRPEEHIDGVSLVPLLNGKTISNRPLYWHYPHYGNQGGDPSSIMREGDWKLIHYWEDNSNELYNLHDDPFEKNNVAGDHTDITSGMSTQLLDWLNSVNAKFPIPDPEFDTQISKVKHQKIVDVQLPRLEKQRRNTLTEGWKPNDDWWGSQISK